LFSKAVREDDEFKEPCKSNTRHRHTVAHKGGGVRYFITVRRERIGDK